MIFYHQNVKILRKGERISMNNKRVPITRQNPVSMFLRRPTRAGVNMMAVQVGSKLGRKVTQDEIISALLEAVDVNDMIMKMETENA